MGGRGREKQSGMKAVHKQRYLCSAKAGDETDGSPKDGKETSEWRKE